MINFLCQNEILLLNMLKLFKTQGFSVCFSLNCRILGFSRFPGKVANLLNYLTNNFKTSRFKIIIYLQFQP